MRFKNVFALALVVGLCLVLSAVTYAQGNSNSGHDRDKPGVGNSPGWVPPGQERKANSGNTSGSSGMIWGGALINLLVAGGGPYLDHGNIYIITRDSCKIVDPSTKSDGAWVLSIFPVAGGTSTQIELEPDVISTPVFTSTGLLAFAGYDRNEVTDSESLLSNLEAILKGKKIGGSTLYLLDPNAPATVPKEVFFEAEWITGLATANGKILVVTKYVMDENVVNPGQNSNSIHCRLQENLYVVDAANPTKPIPVALP